MNLPPASKPKSIKKYITWGIIIVVLCILFFGGCSSYNGLVSKEEAVDKAWAEVQVQYQRRFDLIPRLVETVKGYAKHESTTFQNVTKARAGLSNAYNEVDSLSNSGAAAQATSNFEQFNRYNQAQSNLQRAFSIYVNAVHEAYPDLKANQQFADLQVQLEGTENRIAFYRNEYSAQVMGYNLKVKRFPGNIWAALFGFDAKPQYQAETDAQSAPKVEF